MTTPPTTAPSRYPDWVTPVRIAIIALPCRGSWSRPSPLDTGVRIPAASPIRQNSVAAAATPKDSLSSSTGRSPAMTSADPATSDLRGSRATNPAVRVEAATYAAAPAASSHPAAASPVSSRWTKNAPTYVSRPVQHVYPSNSATIQRRAERSAKSTRHRSACRVSGTAAVPRAETSVAIANPATTACATRHENHWVSAPTSGVTMIQARALAPVTYPIARGRSSPENAATPANPAVSRQAKPTPTSRCATMNAARFGAAATAAQATSVSTEPTTSSRREPMSLTFAVIASEATMAVAAATVRAWPTAATEAPYSSAMAAIVGLSTTSSACDVIVASTRGTTPVTDRCRIAITPYSSGLARRVDPTRRQPPWNPAAPGVLCRRTRYGTLPLVSQPRPRRGAS